MDCEYSLFESVFCGLDYLVVTGLRYTKRKKRLADFLKRMEVMPLLFPPNPDRMKKSVSLIYNERRDRS
jgi:hypothetical protein